MQTTETKRCLALVPAFLAGADGRPLAWVSSRRLEEREFAGEDRWELEVRVWPTPARLAALVDFHGNWVDWLEAA